MIQQMCIRAVAEHGGSGSWLILRSQGISGEVLVVPRNDQSLLAGEACRELERFRQHDFEYRRSSVVRPFELHVAFFVEVVHKLRMNG